MISIQRLTFGNWRNVRVASLPSHRPMIQELYRRQSWFSPCEEQRYALWSPRKSPRDIFSAFFLGGAIRNTISHHVQYFGSAHTSRGCKSGAGVCPLPRCLCPHRGFRIPMIASRRCMPRALSALRRSGACRGRSWCSWCGQTVTST